MHAGEHAVQPAQDVNRSTCKEAETLGVSALSALLKARPRMRCEAVLWLTVHVGAGPAPPEDDSPAQPPAASRPPAARRPPSRAPPVAAIDYLLCLNQLFQLGCRVFTAYIRYGYAVWSVYKIKYSNLQIHPTKLTLCETWFEMLQEKRCGQNGDVTMHEKNDRVLGAVIAPPMSLTYAMRFRLPGCKAMHSNLM